MAPAEQREGVRVMAVAHAVSARAVPGAEDFFARARARLTLDVPAALTDPTARRARRSRSRSRRCGRAPASRPTGPPPCSFRWSIAPSRGAAHAARTRICRAMPGRSRFRAARSTPATRARSPRRCAKREEEIGLAAELIEPIGYLDLYLTFSGFRILPTLARVQPDFALALNRGEVDRGIRGAARLPDGRRRTTSAQPRLEGHRAQLLRHAVRRALHLGRHRGHFAQSVRDGFIGE